MVMTWLQVCLILRGGKYLVEMFGRQLEMWNQSLGSIDLGVRYMRMLKLWKLLRYFEREYLNIGKEGGLGQNLNFYYNNQYLFYIFIVC